MPLVCGLSHVVQLLCADFSHGLKCTARGEGGAELSVSCGILGSSEVWRSTHVLDVSGPSPHGALCTLVCFSFVALYLCFVLLMLLFLRQTAPIVHFSHLSMGVTLWLQYSYNKCCYVVYSHCIFVPSNIGLDL